jgi:hypothetical protein
MLPQVLPTCNRGRYIRSKYLASREEETPNPQRNGLCVIGMNFAVENPSDPDSIRMNALQTMYPHTRVWGVSQQTGVDDTPTWRHGDVRSDRFWRHAFPGRNTKLLVVDYRWCPHSYWDAGLIGLGYGNRWFVHHIPLIFKEGGRVCILPNDKNGRVWDMYKAALKKGGTTVCAFLSQGRNPLFIATSVAWFQSNGNSWRATNVSRARANFFHPDSLSDCNSANPFIICYDAKWFNDKHSVENWIDDFARIPQYSKHH